MNTHYYSLQPGPFARIKKGQKSVEMRLNDARRQLLEVGDTIVFSNPKTKEKLMVVVIALDVFKNFTLLYKAFSKEALGYLSSEDADSKDMEQYYDDSMISKYGVLAISIRLLAT